MITFIDMGQSMFIFMLGFVGYIAFSSRLARRGTGAAWKYAAWRVGALYMFALIEEGALRILSGANVSWRGVLLTGTFANLAIGAFAAYLATYLIRHADKRLLIALALMLAHTALFALPLFNRYSSADDALRLPQFPWNAWNNAAVAILGTCFSQWMNMNPEDPRVGLRKRMLPAVAVCFAVCYCLDWLQPADAHDITTSLALMSVGSAGFMVAVCYAFGEIGFRVPVLTKFGRNLLPMFILVFIFGDRYARTLPREFLIEYPHVTLIAVGLAPLFLLGAIAGYLDRKNIVIRL
jgi:hypothetical protein